MKEGDVDEHSYGQRERWLIVSGYGPESEKECGGDSF